MNRAQRRKAAKAGLPMDDMYPERSKLKELGVDLEAWQKEVLTDGQ